MIHYEGDAEGIDTPASDLPRFQGDLDNLSVPCAHASANNGVTTSSTASKTTNYIPTRIVGSPKFKAAITAVCMKHLVVFNTCLGQNPAKVPPMDIEVDTKRWRVNSNKGPPRNQTLEKQLEIQRQTDILLANKVISTSKAEHYSQVHLTPKPVALKNDGVPDSLKTGESERPIEYDSAHEKRPSNISMKSSQGWRFCIDFRALNLCSVGMGWPIPNIRHMLQRLGAKKPRIFGKLDFTSGYFQAPLSVASRIFTAFTTHAGMFEFNRAAMGLKGAGPLVPECTSCYCISWAHVCHL